MQKRLGDFEADHVVVAVRGVTVLGHLHHVKSKFGANVSFGILRVSNRVAVLFLQLGEFNRHDVIVKDTPNFDKQKFLYHLSRSNYEHDWGTVYRKPGLGTRILAFFLKIVPKVGPFKAVNFKIPTQQTEDIYIKSVNATMDDCNDLLRDVRARKLDLANTDYDTGKPTKPGEYSLSDQTYARLIDELSTKSETGPDRQLRANLLSFYSDPDAPLATRKNAKAWKKLQEELEKLKDNDAAASVETTIQNQ